MRFHGGYHSSDIWKISRKEVPIELMGTETTWDEYCGAEMKSKYEIYAFQYPGILTFGGWVNERARAEKHCLFLRKAFCGSWFGGRGQWKLGRS